MIRRVAIILVTMIVAATAGAAMPRKALFMRHRGNGGGGGDSYSETAWSWLDFNARDTLYSDNGATTIAGDGSVVMSVRDRAHGSIWTKFGGGSLTQTNGGVHTEYRAGMYSRGALACPDYLWDGAEVLGTSNVALVVVFSATGPMQWSNDFELTGSTYGIFNIKLKTNCVAVTWGYAWPTVQSIPIDREQYFFDGLPHVVVASLFGGETSIRVDGAVVATSMATSSRKWTDKIILGNNSNGAGNTIDGIFHEFCIYDSEVDIVAAENAIIAKYGITRMVVQ